jgi:mycothiol synthase
VYGCSMAHPVVPPVGFRAVMGPPDDLEEVVDLVVGAETSVDGASAANLSLIGMLVGRPGTDPAHDLLQVRDTTTGGLAAIGIYNNSDPHIESETSGRVHPDHEGVGIGSAIVRWGLERSRTLMPRAPSDARVTNRCQISDQNTAAARLLTDLGYTADRHEIEMQIVFGEPVVIAPLPSGITVRKMSGADDLAIVAGVVTAAFRDHYGWVRSSQEDTMGRWENFRAMDEWDDGLVWIAETAQEAVGVLVGIRTHGSHTDSGFIGSLGVRRQARGRGLARYLLTAACAEYQDRGMRSVALDVDADNLTGATRLYESVGMAPVRAETAYLIELRPGIDRVKR